MKEKMKSGREVIKKRDGSERVGKVEEKREWREDWM